MSQNYTVLARKYRPTTINELKGQEVLVTTLSNAFTTGRIAHAFLLSGVRGVGKTTTARILAKALNCIGEDGNGNITLNPCNKCSHCTAINNDHHLDILEMDAASKTGVDDIREIIETVKYKPSSARYKVYIIDEVHMLSKSAFNALLKTLEEPPSFVKFIFATTEIKKVPITVISRCQRFDLRRLDPLELKQHLASICNKENISFQDNALLLIANAAEGSVRDSLSILDQAINSSSGNLIESIVVELLGKGGKEDTYALFNALVSNNDQEALNILNKLYYNGVEIITIFEELLEVCHLVTMLKTALPQHLLNSVTASNVSSITEIKQILQNLYLTEKEATYAIILAQQLSLNGLVLLWQLLTKGIEELKVSVLPKKAAEMLIIRITWVNEIATLPALHKLLNKENISLAKTNITGSNNTRALNDLQQNLTSINSKEPQQEPKIQTTKETNTEKTIIPTSNSKTIVKDKIETENIANNTKEATLAILESATASKVETDFTKSASNSIDQASNQEEATMEDILELFPEAKPLNEKS